MGLSELLRNAIRNDLEKIAFVPTVGGQVPPPAGDPAAGGMPPVDPAMMGGMPPMPPGDPAMAGMPPMDPAMMAGMPPMDPAMHEAAPSEGGLDPSALEEVNKAETDVDNDGKDDTMVPLSAITQHDIGLIEAMKGRKTKADVPEAPTEDSTADMGGGPTAANIGGMPAESPMTLAGNPAPKFAVDKIYQTILAYKRELRL